MTHKINNVATKKNLVLVVTFFDGTVKEYNIKKLFSAYPQLKELENNYELFKNVKVDTGGYGIVWNDNLDLEAETIWEEGIEVQKVNSSPVLELAAKLVEARYNAGLTQKQLSEKTGIYQADISKIERGLANPSVETLQRLAEGMNVKLKIDFDD